MTESWDVTENRLQDMNFMKCKTWLTPARPFYGLRLNSQNLDNMSTNFYPTLLGCPYFLSIGKAIDFLFGNGIYSSHNLVSNGRTNESSSFNGCFYLWIDWLSKFNGRSHPWPSSQITLFAVQWARVITLRHNCHSYCFQRARSSFRPWYWWIHSWLIQIVRTSAFLCKNLCYPWIICTQIV